MKLSFSLGCFDHDQNYAEKFSNESKPVFSESEGKCQKLCQEDKECQSFSYDSDRKHCWLLSINDIGRKRHDSFISGPKYCTGN